MNPSDGCDLSRDVFSQAPLGPNKGSNNVAKCKVISTRPYGHGRGHTGEYPDKESSNVVKCGVISTCPYHMAMVEIIRMKKTSAAHSFPLSFRVEIRILKQELEDSDACPYQKYYFYVS